MPTAQAPEAMPEWYKLSSLPSLAIVWLVSTAAHHIMAGSLRAVVWHSISGVLGTLDSCHLHMRLQPTGNARHWSRTDTDGSLVLEIRSPGFNISPPVQHKF